MLKANQVISKAQLPIDWKQNPRIISQYEEIDVFQLQVGVLESVFY